MFAEPASRMVGYPRENFFSVEDRLNQLRENSILTCLLKREWKDAMPVRGSKVYIYPEILHVKSFSTTVSI